METSMSPEEIRLECLRLAVQAGLPQASEDFERFVISGSTAERPQLRSDTQRKRLKAPA